MTTQPTIEQIAQDYGSMITRIASSYEYRPHLAEELVQEIYIAVWKALPSFRGNSSLKTFVARIATNRAVTHVSRAMGSPQSVELSEYIAASDRDPEMQTISHDHHTKLASAIRNLPLAYRQPTTLTLEGLTPVEISEILGISANAVAIRLTRAKDLLRSLLGENV